MAKIRRNLLCHFQSKNGKFTPSKLAAKIGSPGFLANHPNGKILYSVGRWDEGSGALGYHPGKNGEHRNSLNDLPGWKCPHRSSSKWKISAYCSIRRRFSLPFFHLMQMENWGTHRNRDLGWIQGGEPKTGFSHTGQDSPMAVTYTRPWP